MRIGWIGLTLTTFGMTTGLLPGPIITPPALAQDYPYQAQSLVMDGIVGHVDANRDRVIFTGDNGRRYTLDTSQSDIMLTDGNRAGLTADLSPGMRVHVSGRLLSAGIAEVEQMRVLDDSAPARPRANRPLGPQNATSRVARPDEIELRGTVESTDTQHGTFVVRVNDHTRTVLLADNTDLSGLGPSNPDRFPVKIGDRLTVAGALQPGGSVLAGAISFSKTVNFPLGASSNRISSLVGRVSAPSNRYTSRDIKIRVSDDREVKIKVPRGISIKREGRAMSVHDLQEGDQVRVTGHYDGSDFSASRIDVLRSSDDPNYPPTH